MFINQCPMERYENIVLALKPIAVVITRPQGEWIVTEQGTPKHLSD